MAGGTLPPAAPHKPERGKALPSRRRSFPPTPALFAGEDRGGGAPRSNPRWMNTRSPVLPSGESLALRADSQPGAPTRRMGGAAEEPIVSSDRPIDGLRSAPPILRFGLRTKARAAGRLGVQASQVRLTPPPPAPPPQGRGRGEMRELVALASIFIRLRSTRRMTFIVRDGSPPLSRVLGGGGGPRGRRNLRCLDTQLG